MKKTYFWFVLGIAAFATVLAACASNQQSKFELGAGGVPDFVQEAIARTAEDSIIGIGVSNLRRPQSAINAASDEARSDIAAQLNAEVKRLSKMYFAGSDLNPEQEEAFNESVTRTLTQASLRKAKRIAMDTDGSGAYWVVLEMLDSDQIVMNAINDQAQKNRMQNTQEKMERLETQMDSLPTAQGGTNYPQYTNPAPQNQISAGSNNSGQGQGTSAPVRQLPQFVRDAIKSVPEDCFIAFGSSKLRSTSGAMNAVAVNARLELARQMETTIQAFGRSYSKGNELDSEAQVSLDESFVRDLVDKSIRSSQLLDADFDATGAYWAVYIMPKDQSRVIANAVRAELAAKKLVVPTAMADDAEARLDEMIKTRNHYYEIVEENANLKKDNAQLRQELTTSEQQVATLENQVKATEAKLTIAELNAVHQAELAAVQADQAARRQAELQRALDAANAEIARRNANTQADKELISQMQVQLERARDEAAAAQRQSDALRAQLNTAQGEAYRHSLALKQEQDKAHDLQLSLLRSQSELAGARQELATSKQQVATLESQVGTAVAQLSAAEASALQQAQRQAVQANQADRQVAALQQEVIRLQTELAKKSSQPKADKEALVQALSQLERARDEAAAERRRANTLQAQLNGVQSEVDRLTRALEKARLVATIGQEMVELLQQGDGVQVVSAN